MRCGRQGEAGKVRQADKEAQCGRQGAADRVRQAG